MAKREAGWYPESFRAMAVERARTCMHLGRLCEELGVRPGTLRKWRREFAARREGEPSPAQLPGETLAEENRRLKRALAEKVLEVDFLQGALQQVEARRRQNIASGARVSTPRSGD
jgi:transposase-like protein